ncbi:male sterility protein-domain-containing protein [Dactylonectria estremocensis]|uniref:Male sterility protein-domain-containing protein n=1 Tax=Dactylonectria estremocensis TaxID=1079267 RepID=A0A9P9EMF9_9HYPO|nr:male sterility protein-domain-containing protein [Dactylonectria estremocensis]
MPSISDENNVASATVILTGSTGSLGSYLLDSLTNLSHVKRVYCLNRAEDGQARQKDVNGTRGLATHWDNSRVEFLHVDLSQPGFGLSREKYLQLLREATHIIHNQWPVNFNWDLSSFEPYIKGVRHLLDFCLDSPRQVEFLFISTIGTVSHVNTSKPVPERPNHKLSPDLGGYSASKHICELIIEEHVKSTSHKKAAICRVGQIAGPVLKKNGMWGKQEWLPTIIASSKHIGVLPSDLGSMDEVNWVPVDLLSDIVLELSGVVPSSDRSTQKLSRVANGLKGDLRPSSHFMGAAENSNSISVYHAVNPHSVDWVKLAPTVASLVGIDSSNIVPWKQWVDGLRLSEKASNLEMNPGVKLLDFFESLDVKGRGDMMMPPLATVVSSTKSKTMASLSPVGTEWMALWVKQWDL